MAGRAVLTAIGPSGARRCQLGRQRQRGRLRAPAASDRFARKRSALGPGLRQRLLRDARIGDGEVSRVMLHELEHPCPPTIISKSSLNVCFWHKADIPRLSSDVRILGVKQTFIGRYSVSAFDPKRTSGCGLTELD